MLYSEKFNKLLLKYTNIENNIDCLKSKWLNEVIYKEINPFVFSFFTLQCVLIEDNHRIYHFTTRSQQQRHTLVSNFMSFINLYFTYHTMLGQMGQGDIASHNISILSYYSLGVDFEQAIYSSIFYFVIFKFRWFLCLKGFWWWSNVNNPWIKNYCITRSTWKCLYVVSINSLLLLLSCIYSY